MNFFGVKFYEIPIMLEIFNLIFYNGHTWYTGSHIINKFTIYSDSLLVSIK